MIKFSYLRKCEFDQYSEVLFGILADNMSEIAPTGNTREDDFNTWHQAVGEGLEKSNRQIILILDSEIGSVIGYFQYYTNDDTFMMEEIQIIKDYQGKQVFRQLYSYVLPQLHSNIRFVEAYANKKNQKSNGILAHIGLLIKSENKSGNSWRYKGDYDRLINWFNQQN